MQKKKTYAVFGLGRYGTAVARELVANGMEVIAVDSDSRLVNDAVAFLPICKCADVTDPEVIARLGLDGVDTVIICMASSLEASVLAIAHCKDIGIKNIIAKCANEMHKKILSCVGATEVVFPEDESGTRLAKNLVSSGIIDMISLSEHVSMVEVDVRSEWVDKNLIELNLRKKYGLNIVAIKDGEEVDININPEKVLKEGMILIVIADTSKLNKLM